MKRRKFCLSKQCSAVQIQDWSSSSDSERLRVLQPSIRRTLNGGPPSVFLHPLTGLSMADDSYFVSNETMRLGLCFCVTRLS